LEPPRFKAVDEVQWQQVVEALGHLIEVERRAGVDHHSFTKEDLASETA